MSEALSSWNLLPCDGWDPLHPPGALSAAVARTIEHITANFRSITQVEDISQAIGFPYNTLRQVFRRETGLTLSGFLTLVRVREALRLLDETDRQIKEISWRVGFDYEGRLVRAFLRLTGQTPQYVRTRNRLARLVRDCLSRSDRLPKSELQVKNDD